MERLTHRNQYGVAQLSCKHTCSLLGTYKCNIDVCNSASAIKKLADYEDAEEQGLIPKFHLGDEFWTIHWNGVRKEKIVMLQQKKDGTWKYRFPTTADYEENEFGKYFFNTKEEAEQALAERKNDE